MTDIFLEAVKLIPGSTRKSDPDNHWGKSGEFECPKCHTGNCMWYRSKINGHFRLQCSTENCLSGMC